MAILQSFEVPSHSTVPNAVSKVLRFDIALCLHRKGQRLLNGPAVVLARER
jgi:hypothetical protein